MADQRDGGIAWSDETVMFDRHGYRHIYQRKTAGPTRRLRREMLSGGLSWCRGCQAWLRSTLIRSGVCRTHANADYRRHYAAGGKIAITARVHARKRNVAPMSTFQAEILMEQSGGRCVYCFGSATTFDHVVPVARGGHTTLGNMVPACVSCNSKKRTIDLDRFITGRQIMDVLVDMIVMAEVA